MKTNRKHRILLFDRMCRAHDLPYPETEVVFAPPRRWRLDYVWEGWLALEIDGGVWASVNGGKSRHFHGSGAVGDMEKGNSAVARGYRVLHCTWKQVHSGEIFRLVARVLAAGPGVIPPIEPVLEME